MTDVKPMNDVKPWYLSKGVWGGLVSLLAAGVAALTAYELDADTQTLIVTTLTSVIGAVLSIYGRVAATKTLTK